MDKEGKNNETRGRGVACSFTHGLGVGGGGDAGGGKEGGELHDLCVANAVGVQVVHGGKRGEVEGRRR